MKDNDMPTYEEYKEAVIEHFSKNRGNSTDEQVRECLAENEDVIEDDYELNKWEFEKGLLNSDEFMHAGVYACAYNLYLLVWFIRVKFINHRRAIRLFFFAKK